MNNNSDVRYRLLVQSVVDYAIYMAARASGKPVLVFQTADTAEVEVCLKNKGFSVV